MITIPECVILLIFVPSVWSQVTIPPPHFHEEHSGLRLPARPECLSTPLQGWKEWVPTSEPRRVEVEWSISNGICSDYNSCFGQDAADDENFTMDPQMEPLTLQEGDALSFHLGTVDAESLAPVMQPYWVSEQGFRDCDLTAGRPIIATPTNTVFMVLSEYLRPGKNYFIGSTTDSILRCEYGLRLNVTVKSHDCTAPGLATSWCWDKGRCVTNLHQSKYSCQCCYGWTAKYCDNENACDVTPLPCKNGATCHDELNPHGQQYHCECYPGYYGATCEYRLDNLCLVERCQNDATCSGNQTHYRCNCLEGFTGPHCEQNINDCDPDPCPEGVCVDKVNDYLCYCPAGRQGRNCEVLLNQCASSPCQNGGFCEVVGDGWQCHCTLGYTGTDCTTTVNLCASNPCGENAEECVPTVNTIECGCKAGFRGARCEQNINECLSVPCQHDGACEDGIGTYTCHCQEGYSGRHCQVSDAIEELDWDNVIVSPEHHVDPVDFNTDEETSEYDRLHNMYIIAGTLGGAVFIAFLVIVVCYCRFHGFDKACPIAQFKHKLLREDTDTNKGIEETSNNDRTVRISSITTEGRPSSDAIVQATSSGGAYGDNTQNAPLMNPLKSQQI